MITRYLKWLPVVDAERCTGCGRCVEACGPKSLEIRDRIAVLVRPETCGSEEHCIAPCPEQALRMRWVEMVGDKDRGKWRADVELDAAPKADARSPVRAYRTDRSRRSR